MSTLPKRRYTIEEYLALERDSETKHEYYAGEIFPLGCYPFAIESNCERHVLIVNNLIASFVTQLRGRPVKVYSHDMRIKALDANPDLAILCGEPAFDDVHKDTLLNPTVLIEVLSPTTEAYDRGKKFELYRKLESLQEYLLVAQDRPHVEHYRRQNDGEWILSEATGLDAALRLPAIECQVLLRDVYDKVEMMAENEGVGVA